MFLHIASSVNIFEVVIISQFDSVLLELQYQTELQ